MKHGGKDQAALATRRMAAEILLRVLEGADMETAFGAHRIWNRAAPQDKAFTRQIVMTALRRLGEIRWLIAHCIPRPLTGKLRRVEMLLATGIAQLLWMDVPAYAAVDTLVELAKQEGFTKQAGMVNAVLKRVSREGEALLVQQDAERLNTPGWLWKRWCETYGEATAREIASAHGQEPPLDLSFATDAARQAFAHAHARALPTGSLRLVQPGPVTELPGYKEGKWWVQDAGAALPVKLLGDVRGKTVFDLCAAPGGKTAQLAAAGAKVVAVEKSKPRMERLRENLVRLRLQVETILADALAFAPATPADAVLLDAPCSATGTLRRHPDVAWKRVEVDVLRLAETQAMLFSHAATLVKPGGMLVYAVCSLEKEEGEGQVARFLSMHPHFVRRPVAPEEIGGMAEAISATGDLHTLPCHWKEEGGIDGFFAARLLRRA